MPVQLSSTPACISFKLSGEFANFAHQVLVLRNMLLQLIKLGAILGVFYAIKRPTNICQAVLVLPGERSCKLSVQQLLALI